MVGKKIRAAVSFCTRRETNIVLFTRGTNYFDSTHQDRRRQLAAENHPKENLPRTTPTNSNHWEAGIMYLGLSREEVLAQ
jgi:hypothetical protein